MDFLQKHPVLSTDLKRIERNSLFLYPSLRVRHSKQFSHYVEPRMGFYTGIILNTVYTE